MAESSTYGRMGLLGWLTVLFVGFAVATVLPAAAERDLGATEAGALGADIAINWTDVRQRIDGFGASSYANLDTDQVLANADLLFSQTNGVGLSQARITFPWDWMIDEPQPDRPYIGIEVGKRAQARGAIVWAAPWSPPPAWKSNNSWTHGGYLLPIHYQDYANLIADSVLNLKNQHGINLYAVSIQNEPDNSAFYASCTWTADQLHAFVPVLGNTFAQKGVTSKIMLPESISWRFTLADKTMQDPATAKFVGILAAHAYSMPDGFANPYKNSGKPVWQSEHEVGGYDSNDIGTGMSQAIEIHNFLTQAEVNTWNAWQFSEIMNGKRLYTLGNFSKFVRPGFVRIGVSHDGSVYASAYKNASTGDFAIVAINRNQQQTKTFGLNGFSTTSVTPWVTSATLNLAPQSSIPVTGGSFTAALAEWSITTFVGRAGGSTVSAPLPPTNVRIIR